MRTDLNFVVGLADRQSLDRVRVDESRIENESEGVGVDFGSESRVTEVLLESLRKGVGPDTTTVRREIVSFEMGVCGGETDPIEDPIPPAR